MRAIIGFLALGAVLLAALNWIALLPGGNLREIEMRQQLDALDGRDAAAIGGSGARALDFSAMCIDGSSYLWAHEYLETSAVARVALGRPNAPRDWFVVTGPTTQSFDNGSPAGPWVGQRLSTYRTLYRLGYRGLIGGDWRSALLAIGVPSLGDEVWQPHLSLLVRAVGLTPSRPRGMPPGGGPASPASDAAKLQAEADKWIVARAALLRRVAYYDPHVRERGWRSLLGLNRAVAARGGRMYVIVPPTARAGLRVAARLMPDEVRDFRRLLARVESEGAVVSWHWDDPAFVDDPAMFSDVQHLTPAGAAIFSRRLGEELRDRGVLDVSCPRSPA
jgi:hypothetical protein